VFRKYVSTTARVRRCVRKRKWHHDLLLHLSMLPFLIRISPATTIWYQLGDQSAVSYHSKASDNRVDTSEIRGHSCQLIDIWARDDLGRAFLFQVIPNSSPVIALPRSGTGNRSVRYVSRVELGGFLHVIGCS
jgi:hypothetical protein